MASQANPNKSNSTNTKNSAANPATANAAHEDFFTDRVTSALHETIDNLAARAHNTEESVRNAASQSAHALTEKQHELQQNWQKSKVRTFASKNPVATVGIAFAAGALLTSLFSKK
ncbi:DUF883 domain-containing protein [Flocculibacter collagenilyticus]|uniref:DUF883 domain-containing protein n=1 Tax=Flocculibacter collagenilyticus TaxID=2744479 RepID=UPI0018F2D073|nr:DUF883 domain-containing protein [Flocculibacter collagenilyticus]